MNKKTTFTKRSSSPVKTHNVKSKTVLSNNKTIWEHHGVVLTDPETGYQRILLNSLPTGRSEGPLVLYLFEPQEKKD